MRIQGHERTLIVGKTRSGKSYLAQRLVTHLRRVLVFDALDRVAGDYATDKDIDQFIQGDSIRIKVRDEATFTEVVLKTFDDGWYTVYVDELYHLVPNPQRVVPSLSQIVTMGAGQHIGLIACCQRPARLPIYLFSECEHFFIFRLNYPEDRERIWQIAGFPIQPNVSPDHPHGFYYVNTADDKIYYVHKIE